MKHLQSVFFFFAMISFSGISKAQTIPNGGFENWNSTSFDDLDSPWITSNAGYIADYGKTYTTVTKVSGQTGSAVHLQNQIVGKDTIESQLAAVLAGTQTPTALTGYYRCNMVGHDSGTIFVLFSQGGNFVGYGNLQVGGSVSSFTAFHIPISFFGSPDSMTILASSDNLIQGGYSSPNSWLELDGLSLSGTGITQMAGSDFESWSTHSVDMPIGWQALPDIQNYNSIGVNKSADHNSGNYALRLTGGQELTNGKFNQDDDAVGGQPYALTNDTLTGYYKYTPSGLDSAGILISLQNHGNPVDQIAKTLAPVSSWTPFEIPINATSSPDTMRIDLYSSTNYSTDGYSSLYIDDLQLKSQPLLGIPFRSKPLFGTTSFPDPAQNQLNINFNGRVPSEFGLKIYNLEGRLMMDKDFNSGSSTLSVPIDQLSNGLYFYEITANGATVRNKFVKAD